MHAMMLKRFGAPLEWTELPDPEPGPGQIRISDRGLRRLPYGSARSRSELAEPRVPIIPGHEIVGRVDAIGAGVDGLRLGERVGVPWLGYTCGACEYCESGHENLCDSPEFTGYTRHGGFATATIADARYAFALDEAGTDVAVAPLLCAGLIGWRALVMAGDARRVGLYGFGAAAHILAQVATWQGRAVYAFTRTRRHRRRRHFARRLGAVWAGDSTAPPPEPLDAAIIFAAVGALVPVALRAVRKGGRVVCAGIHMSDIPSFPYKLLWEERQLVSVANLTRQDAVDFLKLAPRAGVVTQTTPYPLTRANQALDDLRNGRFEGAAVLVP